MADKYTAVWVSHTSMNDFLQCPRAYYLKHIYRDKKTNRKIKIVSPPLALGQAVHEVIEALSMLPVEDRFREVLMEKFDRAWKKVSGKNGGFSTKEAEFEYKKKGEEMIVRVMNNPGPLKNKAVKIKNDLPHYWLSEEDNIILCGKIDWLEYLTDSDSVHIIDFKTGKHDENPESLQLPIYYLLAKNCQNRSIAKASYWYLEREDGLKNAALPDESKTLEKVLELAKKIKLSRQLGVFKCEHEGCYACEGYEAILKGDGEYVGIDSYNTDVYILNDSDAPDENSSEIL